MYNYIHHYTRDQLLSDVMISEVKLSHVLYTINSMQIQMHKYRQHVSCAGLCPISFSSFPTKHTHTHTHTQSPPHPVTNTHMLTDIEMCTSVPPYNILKYSHKT